jgi:hypothetical protein
MAKRYADNTWQEDPAQVIVLVNRTNKNFILDMPSGRYRLDAGRSMKTLRSILDLPQVKDLVDHGDLTVEA